MHLSKFFHTQSGKYIMSVILGFGLATFFRSVCKGKQCIVMKAPPLEEIKDKIYKVNEKCYTFSSTSTTCNVKKEIVPF